MMKLIVTFLHITMLYLRVYNVRLRHITVLTTRNETLVLLKVKWIFKFLKSNFMLAV